MNKTLLLLLFSWLFLACREKVTTTPPELLGGGSSDSATVASAPATGNLTAPELPGTMPAAEKPQLSAPELPNGGVVVTETKPAPAPSTAKPPATKPPPASTGWQKKWTAIVKAEPQSGSVTDVTAKLPDEVKEDCQRLLFALRSLAGGKPKEAKSWLTKFGAGNADALRIMRAESMTFERWHDAQNKK
jgi:hypothetical protein